LTEGEGRAAYTPELANGGKKKRRKKREKNEEKKEENNLVFIDQRVLPLLLFIHLDIIARWE